MTGAVIIDGTDIATLGALILRGGDTGFIQFPTRKEPVLIEWPDEHGFEIASDAPVYTAKEFTVNYYLKGDASNFKSRLNAFADLHFVGANKMVYVREFDTTFSLRFAGISDIALNRGFTVSGEKSARLSVDYVMDAPTAFIDTAAVATANRQPNTHVTINGVDLAAYGVIVSNVYSSALKLTPKAGIVYSSQYSSGQDVIYPGTLKREKQTIIISCAMVCGSKSELLNNYYALFNAIDKSSVTIGLTAAEKTYTAYYIDVDNFSKRPLSIKPKLVFDLNFVGYENDAND